MVHMEFFDSVEEMFEAERKAREAADARTKEWQKQIKAGDCFRQSTDYGFDIYGEVLEEYEEEHLQNYRFCYCFSEACPEGEKGDVHVSVIDELISREAFEEIKKKM
jgi:hypothetical protein